MDVRRMASKPALRRAGEVCLPSAVPTAAVVALTAYVAAQLVSNIASLKIGLVAGYAVDMGTFLYPVTFTLRDLVHKSAGKRGSQVLVLSAGAANLFMSLYLMWCARVPSDPSWALGAEFMAVLDPVWRIATASILAGVVAELLDTEIYQLWVDKATKRYQWMRVLVSNSVSVPVDNLIFALGAFAFSLPWQAVWEIFLFNLVVKYGMTLLSTPMIYLTRERCEEDRD